VRNKIYIYVLILLSINCFNSCTSGTDDDKTFYTCLALTTLKKDVRADYQITKLLWFGDKIVVKSERTIPYEYGLGSYTSSAYLISSNGGTSWDNFLLPPKDRYDSFYNFYTTSDSIYNLRYGNLDQLSTTNPFQWVTYPFSFSNNDTVKFLDTYDRSILLATDLAVYKYDTDIQSLVKLFNFSVAGSISAIDFSDSANGWIISNRKIYNSTDGGQNWNLKYTYATNSSYSGIFALSNSNFYFTSLNSIIYTVDNGVTWLTYSFADIQALSQLFFYSKTMGFVLQNGHLYKTIDQGNSWTKSFPDSTFTEKLTNHIWITDKIGYAVGIKSIYETIDSGLTWKLKNSDVDYYTYKVRATPPMLCEF